MNDSSSPRSRGTAMALGVTLGIFGAHRFYVGKVGTGILMACTLGGCGLWVLYDCVMIGTGEFTDKEGRQLRYWDPATWTPMAELPEELTQELDDLRAQVAELNERVDFAERLLADPARPRSAQDR